MTLIDHTNYNTQLIQSSSPRGSSPDGNIYFGENEIQLITAEELAQVDLGSGLVVNPLNNKDGITLRGLYNFENQERRTDELLRQYIRFTQGRFRYVGAYEFIDGNRLAAGDESKVRGSGWVEFADADATQLSRIYHGLRSLNSIDPGSQPYYAFLSAQTEAARQAATWTDFSRVGPIDEAVQVFGDTSHGDAGAGNFDHRVLILEVRVRTFGNRPGQTSSQEAGITELYGFTAGYGLGEVTDTNNTATLADVFGGAAVAPYTGLSLERVPATFIKSGFNEADGIFTWRLNNTEGATAQQCANYLDAIALQDADIDAGAGSYNGRKGRVWYSRDANGRIVTSSVDGEGLFIDGLSTTETQNVIQKADNGDSKTYPFFPEVRINVGAIAEGDPLAWYHAFFSDGPGANDFNTPNAVTVQDKDGSPVKGNVATNAVGGVISFPFDYDGDTLGGTAATDKQITILVEGDGVAAQSLVEATITRISTINISAAPTTENNA
ncbi:MAG: hypothetical protein F6J87_14920 [Spirulina sp. SIO3F2]|nr:hypothetical protein [Spirulina sp. SIO3F2]